MSSRNVIKQNPDLRIDQVELPYTALVICNEQLIINVLMRTYNISPQEAWDRWYRAVSDVDPIIVQILEDMINNRCEGEGLPVIINRNPSIAYGSLLQMYCKGINYDYTMSMPLQVLPLLAADFDGDVLNILFILNYNFYYRANQIFNPRNAFYISRNNGLLNPQVMPCKDMLINAACLNDLTYKKYTKAEINNIERIKQKYAKKRKPAA